LAFVAGATNAGGFLAVRQYTSHMTGIVSAMANNVAISVRELVLGGVDALVSLVLGSTCFAVMVNYARRHTPRTVAALLHVVVEHDSEVAFLKLMVDNLS